MSMKRLLGIVLLICPVLLTSCSKKSRAKRSLRAAGKVYLDARNALLSADTANARELADTSLAHAEKAASLVPPEEQDKASSMQIEAIRSLVSSFQDPGEAVRLYYLAKAREDHELASFLVDARLALVEAKWTPERFLPNQTEMVEKALSEAFRKELDRRSGDISKRDGGVKNEAIFGETAQVRLLSEEGAGPGLTVWLHQEKGPWRIYDLSLGDHRCTKLLAKALSLGEEDIDLSARLQGKSLRRGLHELSKESSLEMFRKARNSLLTGDCDKARSWAQRSADLSEQAASLARLDASTPRPSEETESPRLLASAFADPVPAVDLWLHASAEGDEELTSFLFDSGRAFSRAFGDRQGQLSEEDWTELAQAVAEAFHRTTRRYKDILSASGAGPPRSSISNGEAVLVYRLELSGQSMETRVWLHQEDDVWRIYDVSVGKERCSDVAGALASALDGDVDLVPFFEDKDLLEALSALRNAERLERMFETKPILGQYVRLTKPATLVRGGQKEPVGQGTMLKVMGQGKNKAGEILVFVRTTEAELKESAMGAVPLEDTETVGSDETELWGVETVK